MLLCHRTGPTKNCFKRTERKLATSWLQSCDENVFEMFILKLQWLLHHWYFIVSNSTFIYGFVKIAQILWNGIIRRLNYEDKTITMVTWSDMRRAIHGPKGLNHFYVRLWATSSGRDLKQRHRYCGCTAVFLKIETILVEKQGSFFCVFLLTFAIPTSS